MYLESFVFYVDFYFSVGRVFPTGGWISQTIGSPQFASDLFEEWDNIARLPGIDHFSSGCLGKQFHACPDLHRVVEILGAKSPT